MMTGLPYTDHAYSHLSSERSQTLSIYGQAPLRAESMTIGNDWEDCLILLNIRKISLLACGVGKLTGNWTRYFCRVRYQINMAGRKRAVSQSHHVIIAIGMSQQHGHSESYNSLTRNTR